MINNKKVSQLMQESTAYLKLLREIKEFKTHTHNVYTHKLYVRQMKCDRFYRTISTNYIK